MNKVETAVAGRPAEPRPAHWTRHSPSSVAAPTAKGWSRLPGPRSTRRSGAMLLATTDQGLVRVALSSAEEDDLPRGPGRQRLAEGGRACRRSSTPCAVSSTSTSRARARRSTSTVDWRLSHGFRRDVLEILHDQVPFGHVVSYKELAERAGHPRASRAVGHGHGDQPRADRRAVPPCPAHGRRARRLRRRPRHEAAPAPARRRAAQLTSHECWCDVVAIATTSTGVRGVRRGRGRGSRCGRRSRSCSTGSVLGSTERGSLSTRSIDGKRRIDGLGAVGRRDQPVLHRQHDRGGFECAGRTERVTGDALGGRDGRARACRTAPRSLRLRRRRSAASRCRAR